MSKRQANKPLIIAVRKVYLYDCSILYEHFFTVPLRKIIPPIARKYLNSNLWLFLEMPIMNRPEYEEVISYHEILDEFITRRVNMSSIPFTKGVSYSKDKQDIIIKMRHGDPPNFEAEPLMT